MFMYRRMESSKGYGFSMVWFLYFMTGLTALSQYSSPSGPLTHLLLDDTGHVLVGGKNIIMRLSQNLTLMENFSVQGLSNCTGNGCDKGSEDNNVSIFIMYPYKNENFILLCGTMGYGNCTLFNSTNLRDNIQLSTDSSDHYLGSKTSALAIVVPVTGSSRLFSAMDYDGRVKDKFPKVFSVRTVREEYQKLAYTEYDDEYYITLKDSLFNQSLFDFKYGFHFNNYTYFLRNRKSKPPRAEISEMCSNDRLFRSYIESEISCNGYALIQSAFMLNHGHSAVLYIAFTSSKHRGSVICEFNIDERRQEFHRIQSECYFENIGSAPNWINGTQSACREKQPSNINFNCGRQHINTRIKSVAAIDIRRIGGDDRIMTSLLVSKENNAVVFYCGFEDGTVSKFLQVNSGLMVLYSLNLTSGKKVNNGMVMDPTSRGLYLTYGNTVAVVRTDNCSLHSSCVTCLSDTVSCQWCQDGDTNRKCVAADQTCKSPKHSHCEPEILSVSPITGPTAGGTLMTLTGLFGDHINSLYRVTIGSECTLNHTGNKEIQCTTGNASLSEEFDIQLQVTYLGSENETRPVPVDGSTTFHSKFAYKDPAILRVEPNRISRLGRPILVITGRDLDIGSTRQCVVAGTGCDILGTKSTELTIALTNESRTTGAAELNYRIDSAVRSVSVAIIQSPFVDNIQPNQSIQSGGITLTVTGSNLDGMGQFIETNILCGDLSCEDETADFRSQCLLKSDTTMFCLSPPINTDRFPAKARFSVKNKFGKFFFNVTNECDNLTIHEDPEIFNFTETISIKSVRTSLEIQGKRLKNIEMREIKVTVGAALCKVTHVTDDVILCVFEIPSHLPYYSGITRVQIGNIVRIIGTAEYQKPQMKTGIDYSGDGGPSPDVVIISALVAVVVITVLVTLVMKRLRLGPFKERTEERFNVVYRNGGSDVLTLDGLSENHATDISQNRQNTYQEQTFRKPTVDEAYDTSTEPFLPVIDEDMKLTLERQRLIVDRDLIILGEIIGQGHFGCVYKGYLQTPGEKEEHVVAAKTLHRKNPKDLDINMFLKEALIMKDFQHCHVMKLIGICIGHDGLPLVILPYMEGGDLLTYLRDPRNVPTVKDLVTFGVDIANGMCYLAELKFVHRDLAARNCMMDENCHVKVADFGLSRDVYEKEYYSSCDKTTKLPVKWMAPESLEFGMYSSKSDVWSYGVVLWELLTRGVNPYPEVDNWDILKYLKMGRRMSQPSFCPEEMYIIMQRCWSWEAADRPRFGELTVEIPALLKQLEHPAGERGNKINIETTYVNFMCGTSDN